MCILIGMDDFNYYFGLGSLLDRHMIELYLQALFFGRLQKFVEIRLIAGSRKDADQVGNERSTYDPLDGHLSYPSTVHSFYHIHSGELLVIGAFQTSSDHDGFPRSFMRLSTTDIPTPSYYRCCRRRSRHRSRDEMGSNGCGIGLVPW